VLSVLVTVGLRYPVRTVFSTSSGRDATGPTEQALSSRQTTTDEPQTTDEPLHESYVRGEQTLSRIRTNILLGSIYLRDALIDVSRRESYRVELMRLRTEADGLLGSYLPDVSSAQEREHWTRRARCVSTVLGLMNSGAA